LNDGAGTFSNSGQSLGSSDSHFVDLGDVDGDSDLDAFFANTNNQPNRVWLNNGAGVFVDSGQSLGGSKSYGLDLGDVDGDGDLDAVTTNSGGQANRVWLNDGAGIFSDSGQSLGSSESFGLQLGDIDGDGDLDAFVTNHGHQANKVWLNDGNGVFSDSGQLLGSSSSRNVGLGDIDRDGDLDAFVANTDDQANKIWLNVRNPSSVVEIDTERDITVNGIGYDDLSGISVASGDINDDGSPDLIIGSVHPGSDPNQHAGEVYVLFGPLASSTYELSSDPDIVIAGLTRHYQAGHGVATGDINDDGADDLIIGEPSYAGRAYVFFGPLSDGDYTISDSHLVVNGAGDNHAGYGVGSGDMDNDGIADLIVGSPAAAPGGRADAGEVSILFGPLGPGVLELSSDTDILIRGGSVGDSVGVSVECGDLSGDDITDLILSAPNRDVGGKTEVGQTYVLFGPLEPGAYDVPVDADVTANGVDSDDHSGLDIGTGDVNNDGSDDLIVGAYGADPHGLSRAGETYVVYGPLTTGAIELESEMDITFNGIGTQHLSGHAVSTGDINNDGLEDLIIGAMYAPDYSVRSGQTYVLFGELPVTTIGDITAPIIPIEVNSEITADANFTNPNDQATHTATWDWGDNSQSSGTVIEANGSGSVSGDHVYSAAGVYTITLTVTDSCRNSSQSLFHYVVVYDPSAGFVTGGGWIDSPQGVYTADPSLAGKATFGFVSRYQKGKTTPTGQTEFQFKVADLNFHSDNYDWLIVAGAKAMYKGTGTINGVGNYGFLLSAIDEKLTPSTDVDLFRIKIWDMDNGDAVVYDNQLGDADDAAATTAIGGGSIVIHSR
jgi:hypothetical protein